MCEIFFSPILTSCLSQKIRTERLKLKTFANMEKKDFSIIASGSKDTPGRKTLYLQCKNST